MSLTQPEISARALQICESDAPLPLGDAARRDLTTGLAVALGFFGLFGGWAALAPLDAAMVTSGAVIVDGHRQTLQARDGGVISALNVKEGDHVRSGQALIQLAVADAQAAERSLASRVIHRQVEIARLLAEQRGVDQVAAPAEFAAYTGVNQADALETLKAAQVELSAERHAQQARHAVLSARLAQTRDQINGVKEQANSNAEQQALNAQELKGLKELAAEGYAPLTRVRALERSGASLVGDAGAEAAEVARLQAVAGETRMQQAEGDSDRAQVVAQDLRTAEADLQVLLPQWKAAQEQLSRAVVRAPASGRVVGLSVNTIGGVVAPGQRLLELVPDQARLVVEARIAPKIAAELKPGQKARLRFSQGGDVHEIDGRVDKLSADALTDERSGLSYYLLDVSADPGKQSGQPQFARFARLGANAQIMVAQRKRSALQYWLEPLAQRLWRSFHED